MTRPRALIALPAALLLAGCGTSPQPESRPAGKAWTTTPKPALSARQADESDQIDEIIDAILEEDGLARP